ncbi:protein of unknown function [uncultured Sphingopyxis sp.]|uniref:Uncharacterized protein n=1 Tax=uncultured Sphingopyxis sp. TaxID=310581 RepID=A0A1Y5PYI2_9SPHN|nr:protein of unknown function [uncultured Sphingopyxis sp.]
MVRGFITVKRLTRTFDDANLGIQADSQLTANHAFQAMLSYWTFDLFNRIGTGAVKRAKLLRLDCDRRQTI